MGRRRAESRFMESAPFVALETLGNTKALGRMFHDIAAVAGNEGRVSSTFGAQTVGCRV